MYPSIQLLSWDIQRKVTLGFRCSCATHIDSFGVANNVVNIETEPTWYGIMVCFLLSKKDATLLIIEIVLVCILVIVLFYKKNTRTSKHVIYRIQIHFSLSSFPKGVYFVHACSIFAFREHWSIYTFMYMYTQIQMKSDNCACVCV